MPLPQGLVCGFSDKAWIVVGFERDSAMIDGKMSGDTGPRGVDDRFGELLRRSGTGPKGRNTCDRY